VVSKDERLKTLHDHYKETFARVREVEATRDRLFLWVIGLFALLILEIGYPTAVAKSLGKLTIFGGEVNLQALPLAPLLNASWVLTLVIGLRYCKASIWVDRQYPYVHMLEEVISPLVGGGDCYRREGKVYLEAFPKLLDVAWIAYTFLFPAILLFATAGLIIWEWAWVRYPWYNRSFDTAMAVSLLVFFFLYRVEPYVADRLSKRSRRAR